MEKEEEERLWSSDAPRIGRVRVYDADGGAEEEDEPIFIEHFEYEDDSGTLRTVHRVEFRGTFAGSLISEGLHVFREDPPDPDTIAYAYGGDPAHPDAPAIAAREVARRAGCGAHVFLPPGAPPLTCHYRRHNLKPAQ